jgi:adenylate cyclase
VAGISITFYIGSSKILVNLYTRLARTTAARIIDRTVTFLEIPGNYTQMLASLFENTDIIENHSEIWWTMWQQLRQAPHIASFYIADSRGNFVQTRQDPELATRIIDQTARPATEKWIYRDSGYKIIETKTVASNFDPRVRPWYHNTEKTNKIYWSDVYIYYSTRKPGITGSHPILDKNGNLTAIIGVDITLHSLAEFVNTQRLRKNAVLFIVNDKDQAITEWNSSDKEKTTNQNARLPLVHESLMPWVVDAYNKHKATGHDIVISTTNGIEYMGVFVDFPDSFGKKWKIAAVVPEAEVTGPTRKIIYQAVFIAAVITLTCLLLVYIASGWITQPIKKLAGEAGLIKDFQLEKVAGVHSNFTEIRTLNDAFVSMKSGLDSFKRYVPAELVRQLIATGKEAKLGGEKSRLAIMFTDVVGFTTISESLPAEDLMLQLSDYLERLTQIIENELGTVDKYIGDGIMAFWGAPRRLEDPAYYACRAALQCQTAGQDMNQKWLAENKPPMPTCIGIHIGETIVGNVGSSERMNYSIFGDNVNLASRLEGINRFYGTGVIISHDVYQEMVKGKTKRIKIYELVAEKDTTISKELANYYEQFEGAINAYLKKEWDHALQLFEELHQQNPADKPVKLFIERCRQYRDNLDSLPANWDGGLK